MNNVCDVINIHVLLICSADLVFLFPCYTPWHPGKIVQGGQRKTWQGRCRPHKYWWFTVNKYIHVQIQIIQNKLTSTLLTLQPLM